MGKRLKSRAALSYWLPKADTRHTGTIQHRRANQVGAIAMARHAQQMLHRSCCRVPSNL